jgi:hypothetical protein
MRDGFKSRLGFFSRYFYGFTREKLKGVAKQKYAFIAFKAFFF